MASMITISLAELNLCPDELSNNIIVLMWRNIPITTAFICAEYWIILGTWLARNVPAGDISPKIEIEIIDIVDE